MEKTDHYKVLKVKQTASQTEIKKAFYLLLPQYPPEKNPTEYKTLRQAFDVLYNPVSRGEYDNLLKYGGEIEILEKKIQTILNEEKPDYNEAIRFIKKAVVLGPNIAYLKNMLGSCMMELEDYEGALRQFQKAAALDQKNISYKVNAGWALTELKSFDDAEKVLVEAWSLDKEDYSAPRQLSHVYFESGRKDSAIKVLQEAIDADGKLDFQDFFCIYDLLYLYAFEHNISKLKYELKRVETIAVNQADKQFASFMLTKIGAQLSQYKIFELADEFLSVAKKLDPSNLELGEFTDYIHDANEVMTELNRLFEDDEVHIAIKEIIRLRIGERLEILNENDPKEKENLEFAFNYIENYLDIDPESRKIKDSARNIRQRYKNIYSKFQEMIDFIINSGIASKISFSCVHCSENIIFDKNEVGQYTCPHCNREVYFHGTSISKVSNSNLSNNDSDCFVVTATYGDPLFEEVQIFRKFRDLKIKNSFLGRKFIGVYWIIGPILANSVRKNILIKKISIRLLNIILHFIKQKV